MEIVFLLIRMIVFLVVLLYAANQLLKYMNNRSQQFGDKKLQVLERVAVSKSSAIGIVKILDKYYVMSLAEQTNEIMRELEPEEVERYLALQSKPELVPKQFSQFFHEKKEQLTGKRKETDGKE
jgi:flagellar protein FliO/FliZ